MSSRSRQLRSGLLLLTVAMFVILVIAIVVRHT